jgi:rhodanese-related sulfurtransferase
MTARLSPLKPADLAARLAAGKAVLIDIREPDEFARGHIGGALSRPLSGFEAAHLSLQPGKDVVFTCRTGMRTGANCDRLAARVEGDAFVLEGGLDGWSAAGLPVIRNEAAPLEMFRQVQIGAGALALAGAILGFAVHPVFHLLSGVIGAGLLFAGVSGFCGMAKVLALAPWNRRAA